MPRKEFRFYVYIVASAGRVLYIGITSRLVSRVGEHRRKAVAGFSARYNCHRLVYFERFSIVHTALTREKQLKRWRREKKVALIESLNPDWKDLQASGSRTNRLSAITEPKGLGKVPRLATLARDDKTQASAALLWNKARC